MAKDIKHQNYTTEYIIKLYKMKNGALKNRLMTFNRNEVKEIMYDLLRRAKMYDRYNTREICRARTTDLIQEVIKVLDEIHKI